MIKADTYSKTGSKLTQTSLDKTLFELKLNKVLIKQAYDRYHSNQRTNNAKTLTRGLVSGGGKKPWRQKGTGRARTGSIRNPIWRGGGTTFGPSGIENYNKKMPQRMRREALKAALSAKAKQVKIIELISFSEYKTQKAINLLAKLHAEGTVLVVLQKTDPIINKSFANIPEVKMISYDKLNVYDVINTDTMIIEKPALIKIKEWLSK